MLILYEQKRGKVFFKCAATRQENEIVEGRMLSSWSSFFLCYSCQNALTHVHIYRHVCTTDLSIDAFRTLVGNLDMLHLRPRVMDELTLNSGYFSVKRTLSK